MQLQNGAGKTRWRQAASSAPKVLVLVNTKKTSLAIDVDRRHGNNESHFNIRP
jgi:hypothetical protein